MINFFLPLLLHQCHIHPPIYYGFSFGIKNEIVLAMSFGLPTLIVESLHDFLNRFTIFFVFLNCYVPKTTYLIKDAKKVLLFFNYSQNACLSCN